MEAYCGFLGSDAEEVGLRISDMLEKAALPGRFIVARCPRKPEDLLVKP
jgi:hypothetical protein